MRPRLEVVNEEGVAAARAVAEGLHLGSAVSELLATLIGQRSRALHRQRCYYTFRT